MWENIVIHSTVALVIGLSADPKRAKVLMPVLIQLRDALNEIYPATDATKAA